MSILGKPLPRLEDPRFLAGGGRFVADLPMKDALHVALVRSPSAYGLLLGIDTSLAARVSGIVDILTASKVDLPTLAPFPPLLNQAMPQPLLASGVVRYVGEPVAAVIARTQHQAEDGARLVSVETVPLPAIVDPRRALADDVLIHPDAGTNVAFSLKFARPFRGDVLEDCEVVVRQRMYVQRAVACPLEPRAVIADATSSELTLWAGAQAPHVWRERLAQVLGLPVTDIRVATVDVGGAFGSKALPGPEEYFVAWLALRYSSHVRWCETRSESMTALGHGRAQYQEVAIGGSRDGSIDAYQLDVVQDCGAYPRVGGLLPIWARTMLTGPYDIRRARFSCQSVVTTTTPVIAYRGAGQPEAVAALERAVDLFARAIGMDAADVRRRNLVPPSAMPYTSITRSTYDSGDYPQALEMALSLIGYTRVRKEQRLRRERADKIQVGVGIATFVEVTGANVQPESAVLSVHSDGRLSVKVATVPQGQGHATAWAMLAAEQLGFPMELIVIVQGDTAAVGVGAGTGGSRSVQTAGVAIYKAAGRLAERARQLAATFLGTSPEEVVLNTMGRIQVQGNPQQYLTWEQLAKRVGPDELTVEHSYTPTAGTYPYGTHVAVVEVDTSTGAVRIMRYLAVSDAGTLLNPMMAEGQVRGGIAQGVGLALFEEMRYRKDGTPETTSLDSYGIPSAADLPEWEIVFLQTPTNSNPLGAKGIGESGALAAPVAIQNAVVDALSHLGINHLDLPMTPERVWQAINAAGRQPN